MGKTSYSIGEFSKRTGVSVRTLHYYDELGLLTPEKHPDSGHRFYKDTDVQALQKIISLKSLGYRLKEIRGMLKTPSFTVDLNHTLQLHVQKLEDEKAMIEESMAAIRRTIRLLEEEGEISSPVLMSLNSSIQNEKRQRNWLEDHQLDKIAQLYTITEEEEVGLAKAYTRFSNGMKRLYGRPAEDKEVQEYVAQYIEATLAFIDEETMQQLKQLDLEEEKIQEFEAMLPVLPFSPEEEEWMYEAMEYYYEKNGMIEAANDS